MSAHPVDIPVAALHEAAHRSAVVEAMGSFYAEADGLIARQPGTCASRGACCRFGEYGHRLHVTALEVCYYLAGGEASPSISADACPHVCEGKCRAHARRPLGCRIFYCDPCAESWQGPLTEQLLARLRAMHEELNVPYFYADWMAILRSIEEESLANVEQRRTNDS